MTERLILALGLGSTGQHITTDDVLSPTSSSTAPNDHSKRQNRRSAAENPGYCQNNVDKQVCHHVTTQHDRRSVRETTKKSHNRHHSTAEPEPLQIDPIPFDFHKHGARYRRESTSCSLQYVLFILDMSGSIGRIHFNMMTTALSDLLPHFCKDIKVAVMTFNHNYYVEFCFNCYESGAKEIGEAMRNIQYRAGWTHTGGAAKCVCDFMLDHESPECRIDLYAAVVDVVFITDGRSNDPLHDICAEIECLHNNTRVVTYAIEITDHVNDNELKCIVNNDNSSTLFQFGSFHEFKRQIENLTETLKHDEESKYQCIHSECGIIFE